MDRGCQGCDFVQLPNGEWEIKEWKLHALGWKPNNGRLNDTHQIQKVKRKNKHEPGINLDEFSTRFVMRLEYFGIQLIFIVCKIVYTNPYFGNRFSGSISFWNTFLCDSLWIVCVYIKSKCECVRVRWFEARNFMQQRIQNGFSDIRSKQMNRMNVGINDSLKNKMWL